DIAVRAGACDRSARDGDDAMSPEPAEARDDPIADDLQPEIVGDERQDDRCLRRDEKGERGDPSEMGGGHHWVVGRAFLLAPFGKKALCVASRVNFLEPALREHKHRSELRTAYEIRKRHGLYVLTQAFHRRSGPALESAGGEEAPHGGSR